MQDPRKFARCKELLKLQEELKQARKVALLPSLSCDKRNSTCFLTASGLCRHSWRMSS